MTQPTASEDVPEFPEEVNISYLIGHGFFIEDCDAGVTYARKRTPSVAESPKVDADYIFMDLLSRASTQNDFIMCGETLEWAAAQIATRYDIKEK